VRSIHIVTFGLTMPAALTSAAQTANAVPGIFRVSGLSWSPGRRRSPGDAPEGVSLLHPGGGPPVFISGCNRGGTSILSLLLGQHPQLRNVGKGPHHEGQWIWKRRFYDGSHHRWAVPPWLATLRKTEADATPEILEYFRQAFASACAGTRMVEKTPSNAIRIPFINCLYPDCTVIHVLRDGRHTAASLMARGVPMPYAPHQWVSVHTIALPDMEALGPERGLLVRYEELLETPMEVLARICRHCALDDGAEALAALRAGVVRHLKEPRDRWRILKPETRREILDVIGELQASLGYPVDG
jgi:hypothetical protein